MEPRFLKVLTSRGRQVVGHRGYRGHTWKQGQWNQTLQVHRGAEMTHTSYWVVGHELLISFSEAGWVASSSLEALDEELGRVRIREEGLSNQLYSENCHDCQVGSFQS